MTLSFLRFCVFRLVDAYLLLLEVATGVPHRKTIHIGHYVDVWPGVLAKYDDKVAVYGIGNIYCVVGSSIAATPPLV